MIDFEEITFVVQGPIHPRMTERSLFTLRKQFPGSHILLSTWEGQDTNGLDFDEVIFNQDPGPTTFVYSKNDEAVQVNINRQIVSSYSGLEQVKTRYAAKLRADNVLHSTNMLHLFRLYPKRDSAFSFLNNRLVCSNFFAKEFERGLPIPYFFSDFFQFGETEDLKRVWTAKRYENYIYREALSGKKQHEHYPRDSVNVEQKIWSHFADQFIDAQLNDEHGSHLDVENSQKVMLNNLIVVDGDVLGLEVPLRLQQGNGYPYDLYTYLRWQWLYEKAFGENLEVPLSFKVKWQLAKMIKWLQKGLRLKIRKAIRAK